MKFDMGFLGIFVLLLTAFLLSKHKRAIKPRTVLGAFALQLGFALVLYVPQGKQFLQSFQVAYPLSSAFLRQGYHLSLESLAILNSALCLRYMSYLLLCFFHL